MFIGITTELLSPDETACILSELVSIIFSKFWTTGCIVVNNLVVELTLLVESIHLELSKIDLLLPTNERIDESLYPKLNSVDPSTLVIELLLLLLNELPMLSESLLIDVDVIES